MFDWLYRHIFRGIEIVFLAGMITALLLALWSYERDKAVHPPARPVAPAAAR